MRGPITTITNTHHEHRAEVRLPVAWIDKQQRQPQDSVRDGSWITRQTHTAHHEAGGPVLALLHDDAGALSEALLTHAERGATVYALVGPAWGQGQHAARLLQAPRVLVRRIAEVPCAALHTPDHAHLWISGDLVLRLNGEQPEALRRCFLRLFWHEATHERWSTPARNQRRPNKQRAPSGEDQAQNGASWREAGERPFDIPESLPDDALRLEPANFRWPAIPKDAHLLFHGGALPATTPKRLWYPPGPDHQEQLASLAIKGAEIGWEASWGLPELCLSDTLNELLLPGIKRRLRVRLMPEQARELHQRLSAPTRWQLTLNARLGDPLLQQAAFWLPGESTARPLMPTQRLQAPRVNAPSLRELERATPTSYPDPQPLVLEAQYSWEVHPPRAPAKAKEDPLVKRWRALDNAWLARLKQLNEALDDATQERERIQGAFARLVSDMLGFGRTHKDLQRKLKALEDQTPSQSGPEGAPELLQSIKALEDALAKLTANQADAERSAREAEEEERQRAAWQSRVENAKRALPKRREDRDELASKLEQLIQDLNALQDGEEPKDKKARKDRKANLQRLGDDRKRAERALGRLDSELEALELASDEKFVFTPTATPPMPRAQDKAQGKPGAAKFIPASTQSTTAAEAIPDEALPKVGALRVHQDTRYLVISDWSELDDGEREAARLNAQLVAQEGA